MSHHAYFHNSGGKPEPPVLRGAQLCSKSAMSILTGGPFPWSKTLRIKHNLTPRWLRHSNKDLVPPATSTSATIRNSIMGEMYDRFAG